MLVYDEDLKQDIEQIDEVEAIQQLITSSAVVVGIDDQDVIYCDPYFGKFRREGSHYLGKTESVILIKLI